jgi:hypothetical protein
MRTWEVEPGRAVGPVELVLPSGDEDQKLTLRGVVRDPEGRPVSPVFVTAFSTSDAGEVRHLSSALAGADGAFTLTFASAEARLRFLDLGGVHEELELPLAPPLSSEPLDVVLVPRASPVPPLEGIVLGPGGAPLEGCDVALRPPEDTLCNCIVFHARTDAAGAFRFERVSAGPHRLAVSHPDFATAFHAPARAGEPVLVVLQQE